MIVMNAVPYCYGRILTSDSHHLVAIGQVILIGKDKCQRQKRNHGTPSAARSVGHK